MMKKESPRAFSSTCKGKGGFRSVKRHKTCQSLWFWSKNRRVASGAGRGRSVNRKYFRFALESR